MRVIHGLIRGLLLAGLLGVGLAACSAMPVDDPGEAVGGGPSEAVEYVEAWFGSVTSGAPDLGWSLIYPGTRDLFVDEATYRSVLEEDDWAKIGYEVGPVRLSDGEYLVQVTLTLAAGAELPQFFERWGFIQGELTDDGFSGVVVVRLGTLLEPSGIQAIGL